MTVNVMGKVKVVGVIICVICMEIVVGTRRGSVEKRSSPTLVIHGQLQLIFLHQVVLHNLAFYQLVFQEVAFHQ